MLINATTPVEVPPTSSIVYDSWVIKQMIFVGEGITRPAAARITFQRGKKNQDGSWTLSDNPQHVSEMNIENIYAEAESDPVVATAIGAFLNAIDILGKKKGVL